VLFGYVSQCTPIFDWCVDHQWGSKNKHHKDKSLKDIELHLQILLTTLHSIVTTHNWEDPVYSVQESTTMHFLITITKLGCLIFNPVFVESCYIIDVDLLMQPKFCCDACKYKWQKLEIWITLAYPTRGSSYIKLYDYLTSLRLTSLDC
jgi:hypothetical protein